MDPIVKPLYFFVVIALSALLAGCETTTNPQEGLTYPTEYPAQDFASNTVNEQKLLSDINALTAIMQTGRTPGQTVSFTELSSAFGHIQPYTTDYYARRIQAFLVGISDASGNRMDALLPPDQNGMGGVYVDHLHDQYGMELEQLVEKGLFGASLYYRAIQIMSNSQLTPADIDKLVALFGASPQFSNSDKAPTNPDVFCAKYASRRDKNDGRGYYTTFRDAAIIARTASAAGPEYNDTVRAALTQMRHAWEKSSAATAINYLYSVINGLSQTEVNSATRSEAMHAYSEAVAFLNGWKGLPPGTARIDDSTIDALLEKLLAKDSEPFTCYMIWQDPATKLTRIGEAINLLKNVYTFTSQEMEDFKLNWVGVQGR